MKRWQRWQRGVLAAVVALLLANLLLPSERRELSGTSWGTVPAGQRALLDLLRALELGGERSLRAPHDLPPGETVWWIEPAGVCENRIAVGGLVDVLDSEAVRWRATEWIEAGGRAVVFLETLGEAPIECDAIAGYALPSRAAWPIAEPLGQGAESAEAIEAVAIDAVATEEQRWPDLSEAVTLSGARLSVPRKIPAADVSVFDEAGDWTVAARIGSDDAPGARPFILERSLGEGTLAVVADSAFVRNERLDAFDAAPLAIDLVRAWGAPKIDERAHGFVPEASVFRYLARSPASPVFVGLGLLGLLYVWRGTSQPARSVPEHDPDVPTLESFVQSLATLYARSGDHARVLERHRELSLGRLRRHYGMSAATPERVVVERLEREPTLTRAASERARSLAGSAVPDRVENAAELRRRVSELDELVREVTG